MKRVCLLLVVIICFSLLAFTAFAADGEETEEAPVTDSVLETDAASDQTEPIKEDELSSQTGLSVPLDSSGPYDETHGSYISGFNDGTFRPNDTLSRAEMAQILYNFGEYEEGPSAFPDVPADKWFAAPINALAHAGILKGFEDGRFHPMQAVTRAELVSVLYRLDGEPETESEPFSDVTDSYWAKDAINYARAKGWVSGYGDNTFRPLNQITRAEAVKVINRYLNRIPDAEAISRETEIRFFPDVLKTAWYYAEVMEAAVPHSAHYEAEGASETGSNYSPDTPHLKNGVYYLNGNLYISQNGCFVHKAVTGSIRGIPYTCTGETGVCKLQAVLVETWDGKLVYLSRSVPVGAPGTYQNGFYLIGRHVYAVHNGYFVNRAGTYKLNGITYTCEGSSGICKAKASLLNIWDGTLVLLKNSVPDGLPGSYQNGFYLLGHHIYAVQNGYFVNKAGTYLLDGVPFTCEGENGVCKPDAKLLNTVDGTLVMLSDSAVSTLPGAYQNGFHLIDGNLYAVHNGYFVNRAGTYKLNRITYTCEGSSGICKVKASLLKTWDGTLVLLKNSVPNGLPGSYQNGFYRFGHHIYAVKGGYFVNSAGSYALNGVSFTCEGGSGVCRLSEVFVKLVDGKYVIIDNGELQTAEGAYDLGGALYCVKSNGYALVSGSWNTLSFGPDGKYTCGNEQIDAYINNVVTSVTNSSMTQEEKLKACFGYVFDNMVYLGNNNHVPRGADPSTWTESYMLRYINMGNRGNCYCFSSFMYYLARRLGYAANAISGAIDKTNDYDHGWMDIEIDGTLYIFDPELGRKWYEKDSGKYPRYRFFKMTYDSAPFLYVRY